MNCLKRFRWAAVLAAASALTMSSASAQDEDTLSISGTFGMDQLSGIVGVDLAAVYANGYDHAWTLTLYGVTYSHEYTDYYEEYDEGGDHYYYEEHFITRVHATSFDFQFLGPNSNSLNAVVSQQLALGTLTDGAILEFSNVFFVDERYEWSPSSIGWTGKWAIGLAPTADTGVSFVTFGTKTPQFASDANAYPIVAPQRLRNLQNTIWDHRPGNDGALYSFNDIMDIGSTEPPSLPPSLRIQDGAVLEGNKGTTTLNLTVTLSTGSSTSVTVSYATADGTASKKSDYTAKSGTLTFQPGQTSKTIAISVKGDRTREPNETFTVKLSKPVGATISHGTAIATILNDD